MSAGWHVVQHVPFEGPGLIAAELSARRLPTRVAHVYRGDTLPDVGDLAGLVVLGGPMNALQDVDHPHLPDERKLLAAALDRGVPVLAVCLGAQLLAAALGARVFAGPAP